MSSLYLLSSQALVLLTLMLALAVMLQAKCMVYTCFRFRSRLCRLMTLLLEAAVFLHLLLLSVLSAHVIHHISSGFCVPNSRIAARTSVFAVIFLLNLVASVRLHSPKPMTVSVIAALTLPITEALIGRVFPSVLFLAVGFWILRAGHRLYGFQTERRNRLSSYSVKEALDTMDSGLLFCRTSAFSNGQILLINRKMQQLMQILTGETLCDGKAFYRILTDGSVVPECKKCGFDSQLLYRLPDGSIWEFELQQVSLRRETCVLLTASDVTASWQATAQLARQNQVLSQRNRQLRQILQDLEAICKAEETIYMKARVHDLLGQQITLLLRSVREHQELDESMLRSFANGLSEALREPPADPAASLQMLINDFKGLGVTVCTEGAFPEEPALGKVFYEISAEAIRNAVRHGYATQITISSRREPGVWALDISDNGIPCEPPVLEGGGLSGMRRRVCELGGSFSYEISPHFSISVTIPEVDIL